KRSLGETRRAFATWSGACLFLAYLSSYDFWIFTPLLLAAVAWHHFDHDLRRTARTLVPLGLWAVAAILCKIATNMWALGGLEGLLRDLRYQSVERATDTVVHTSFTTGLMPVLMGRVEREFTLLFFGI